VTTALALVSSVLVAAPAVATSHLRAPQVLVSLNPIQDNWIESKTPDKNHGGETDLQLGRKGLDESRIVMQFDLSSVPPGAVVVAATLTLEKTDEKGGATTDLVEVRGLATAWTELDSTWNDPWMDAGADFTAAYDASTVTAGVNGPYTWNVTALAGDWIYGNLANNGLVLVDVAPAAGDFHIFGSREDTVQPVLAIDYVIPDPTDFALTKTVDDPTPTVGQIVHYTLTLTNNGPEPGVVARVDDLLPGGVSYVSDNAASNGFNDGAPNDDTYAPLTGVWSVGDLPAGASVSLIIATQVDGSVVGTVTNTATYSGVQADTDSSNDFAGVDIVVPGAELSISKAVDDARPDEGQTITFTVTVTNHGPDPTTGVSVLDKLPPQMGYLSHVAGQGDYDPFTGLWNVGAIGFPGSATLTIDTAIFAASTATNVATIEASNESNPDATNDTAAVEIVTYKALAAGSCIIDMGVNPQTMENGLKPYGLVYDLVVNNGIPVLWSIEAGKLLNGVDFSVGTSNYSGGPFVISAEFVVAAQPILDVWAGKGVVIDCPPTPFSAPIFENITNFPRAVLDRDNGDKIESAFYDESEVPSASYRIGTPADLTVCDDLYAMPHADPQDWSQESAYKATLFAFVNDGGYLWAACHAVSALETLVDVDEDGVVPDMNFLSSDGLVLWEDHEDGTPPYSYDPSLGDLSLHQTIGILDSATQNGSEQIFLPLSGGWRESTTVSVWDPDHPDLGTLSPGRAAVVAYGRAFGDSDAGLVMYEGSHTIAGGTDADNTTAARLYGNFVLQSGIESRPWLEQPIDIPNPIAAGDTVEVSGRVLSGGSPPFTYQWTSDCGGTFGDPSAAVTTFTAPLVDPTQECLLRLAVTDSCSRMSFTARVVGIEAPTPPELIKSASPPEVEAGGVITYNLELVYDSRTPLVNAEVSDPIPANTSYVPGSANAGGALDAGGNFVLWTLGSTALDVPGETFGAGDPITTTLFPVRDTFIRSDQADANFGTADELRTRGPGNVHRALVAFDLGSIPSTATIDTAELRLDVTNTDNEPVTVHEVTAAWSETQVTWNERDASNPWTAPGGDFAAPSAVVTPSSTGFHEIPLTALTRNWHSGVSPNHGVLLDSATGGEARYASREGSVDPSELVVSYTPAGRLTSTKLLATPILFGGTETVTVTMTVEAPGSVTSMTVTPPTTLTFDDGGSGATAVQSGGPSPASAQLAVAGVVAFDYAFEVTAGALPGAVTFTGVPNSPGTTFADATSNAILAVPALTFQVTVDPDVDPDEVPEILNTASFDDDSAFTTPVVSNEVATPISVFTLDYGDLPEPPYPTIASPFHEIVDGTTLGATVDADAAGQPDAAASGDDGYATDDEDGLTYNTPLMPGTQASITLATPSGGALSCFIDFDGDGVLDPVTTALIDAIPTVVTLADYTFGSGSHGVVFDVPTDAQGVMATRCRITSTPGEGGASPTGAASSGEVEDYILAALSGLVWNDSVDGDGAFEPLGDDGLPGGGDDEATVPGVTVSLLDALGTPVTDANGNPITTTTDTNGKYSFPGLPPGSYRVEFMLPGGFQDFTAQNAAPDDIDSDPGRVGSPDEGVTGPVPLLAADSVSNIHAGLRAATLSLITSTTAYMDSGSIVFEFATGYEALAAGFEVYRLDPALGKAGLVTESLIPALVDAPQGGVYRARDVTARADRELAYVIVEHQTNGGIHTYGPFVERPAEAGDRERLHGTHAAQRQRSRRMEARLEARRPESRDDLRSKPRPLDDILRGGSGSARYGRTSPSGRTLQLTVSETETYFVGAREIAGALGASEDTIRERIRSGQIALLNLGQPVSWLAVDGGGTGLLFFGEAIESLYARDNVYQLEIGERGPVMETYQGGRPIPEPGGIFLASTRYEEDLLAAINATTQTGADYWFWDGINAGSSNNTRSFEIEVPQLASGKATLTVELAGATIAFGSDDHSATVRINGTEIGTTSWNGRDRHFARMSFDAGLLAATTTVEIEGTLSEGTSWSIFFIDGFTLDYPRWYRVEDDSLLLAGNGNSVVTVEGLAGGDVIALDVTTPKLPRLVTDLLVERDAAGFRASFLPESPEAEYWLTTLSAARSVDAIEPRHWALDLRSRENRYDHVIIAPEGWLPEAERLVDLRAREGLRSLAAPLQMVYDAFSHGIATPWAIRDFLAYAHAHWLEAPRYVVLAGRGTHDPRNIGGLGDSIIPIVLVGTSHGLVGTDRVLADFRGDDGVPDVAIGRLPIVSAQELGAYVAKLLAIDWNGTWQDRVLMLADNPDSAGEFEHQSEEILAIYEGRLATRVYLSTLPADEARIVLQDSWNEGVGLVNYIGHGGVAQISDEGLLRVSDMSALENVERLPIVAALTCYIGRSDIPGFDSLAEAMVTDPDGGARAVWSPSGLSQTGAAHQLNQLFAASIELGAATLGDAVMRTLREYASGGGSAEWTLVYGITGDPAEALP
jgi:uncharacterized repeat protein (TIGR01451 family)